MTLPADISPFLAPLAALQRLIDRVGGRGVIIGGIASSLLGKPRLTNSVAAMILFPAEEALALIQSAHLVGILPRIPDADQFAKRHRVVLLYHEASGISIDITLGMLPFEEEMVERSKLYSMGDFDIHLPSPEDLIILKAVAHRPNDILDIQAIIESQPDLDCKRIEEWVKQFAKALDMPDLWDDISKYL